MTFDLVRAALAPQRVQLVDLPTPMHRLHRLSEAIGADVWIKRDDAAPLAVAGNKVRKLEYLLGDAMATGCDVLLAQGAPISNVTRATAAAGAASGVDVVLVLAGPEPDQPTGNLLLSGMLGADIRFTGGEQTDGPAYWNALADDTERVERELVERGRRPYLMPVGCSSPRGVVGFVAAYGELLEQISEMDCPAEVVYHASSSAGTHAGLLLGRALAGKGPRVSGIVVADVYDDLEGHVRELVDGACALIGQPAVTTRANFDEQHRGDAYGHPTAAALEAVDLLARTEGIVCDPVYSGKALAAVIAGARAGLSSSYIFWHTGGVQGIFEPKYAEEFWSARRRRDLP